MGYQLTNENMSNLEDLIDTCLNDPGFKEARQSVKAETWEHVGEGATRVADYLIAKYEEINKETEV